MSDYFGFPNMANIPNPSEWKHADTAKDWAEKANNSAVLAKNYAQQIVDSVDVIDEHVHQMDEHITDVTAEVLTAAQTATTKAAQAATSEANASASATSASTSATSAATSATSAADSATAANTYKNTAQSAATDAITAKTAAQTAATTATTKAAEAASSAIDAATAKSYAQQIADSVEEYVDEAETYATNAQTYANAAGTHADEAETSAQLADTKATAATASANAAAASVTQAQQVVSTASAYAAQAQTQATNAATSASAAATSATNAASSADAASISAESASTDAEAASTFADSADSSADAAAASATTAEGHKDNAAASALTAQNFKVQASTFATNAQNSATAAAQSAADAASSASSVNMNEFTEDHTPRYIAETKTLQEGYFILPGAQDGMTSNVVAYDSTQFVRLFKDATAIKQIINAHTFLNEMKITRTAQNTLVCSDPYDNTVTTNWQYNSTKSPENSAYNTTDTYRTVTYTMPTATTSTRTYRLGTTNTARTKTCYCAGELPISGMSADTIYYTVDAAGTTITGRYNTNWTGNEADLQFDYYAKVYYDTLGSAAKLANFKATETINFTGGFEYSYSNGCKFYWTSYSNSGIGRNRKLIDDYASVGFKTDHRVRVHINLPYIDHTDEWNHSYYGGGFLGANLCPNSVEQYRSVYSSLHRAMYTQFDTLFRSNPYWFSWLPSAISSSLNFSGNEHRPSSWKYTRALGRLHTGWSSYLAPFFNGFDTNYTTCTWSPNDGDNYGGRVFIPFMRTVVPLDKAFTEDYTSSMSVLDTCLSSDRGFTHYVPITHDTARYGMHNFMPFRTFNDTTLTASNNLLEYSPYVCSVSPTNLETNSGSTLVTNSRTLMYYGVSSSCKYNYDYPSDLPSVGERMTLANYINGEASKTFQSSGAPGGILTHEKFSKAYNTSVAHSIINGNPISTPISGVYALGGSNPFLNRYLLGSNTNSGDMNTARNLNDAHTLGIRYFDAEAQEWRVFSPGDNCSYSYDGTHWNYRKYLWVDLDKPVTFIVGGLSAPADGNYYGTDCSAFPGATDTAKAYGKMSAYGPRTYYKDFASTPFASLGSTVANDLIHVETPNFDNYTSYSNWHGLTMMTVDYSSSPLGPNDTVYCADSCYGLETADGTIDTTKISCLYGLSDFTPRDSAYDTDYNNTKRKYYNTVNDIYAPNIDDTYSTVGATTADGIAYSTQANECTSFNNITGGCKHKAYHIRIGIES